MMYSEKGVGVIDKAVLDIASAVKLKLQQQGKGISDDDLFIAAFYKCRRVGTSKLDGIKKWSTSLAFKYKDFLWLK